MSSFSSEEEEQVLPDSYSSTSSDWDQTPDSESDNNPEDEDVLSVNSFGDTQPDSDPVFIADDDYIHIVYHDDEDDDSDVMSVNSNMSDGDTDATQSYDVTQNSDEVAIGVFINNHSNNAPRGQLEMSNIPANNQSEASIPPTTVSSTTTTTVPKTPPNSTKIAPHVDTPGGDENDSGCIICLDKFTNYGKHRPAALKCGHIFGHCCLTKWLQRGTGNKCPQCNQPAKKLDVRILFCSSLVAVDTAERDQAIEAYEQEQRKNEAAAAEINDLKLKHHMLLAECEQLRRRIEQDKQQQKEQQQIANAQDKRYISHRLIPLGTKGGGRRIVFDPIQQVLIATQSLDFLSTSQGFGLRKISCLDLKTSKYIKVHDDSIRALSVLQSRAISGGQDKKLCLTCLKSDVAVQSWTTPANVWACDFNTMDSNIVYAGCSNGQLLTYDIRELSRPVFEYSRPNKSLPITSLNYVPISSNFNTSGLLVGGFDGCFFLEHQAGFSENLYHNLGDLSGSCTSLSLNGESSHILATFRPGKSCNHVRHVLGHLIHQNLNRKSIIRVNPVHTFYGGGSMKQMARSCVYSSPTGKTNQLYVAAGDQAGECLNVWETVNGLRVQQMKIQDFVCLDICPFSVNSQQYLAVLSDNNVKVLNLV